MGILPTHWYYNTESGELTQGNNLENLGNNLLGGLGWHELNIPGNATEAQAAAEAMKEFPNGKAPTTSVLQGAINTVGNPLSYALHLTGISGWFTRALKVIFGGALLIMGIAKLTHAEDKILKIAPIAAKAMMV